MNFTMWLQGWVELNGGAIPTPAQWDMIKEHLAISFNKVTKPLDESPAFPPFPTFPFFEQQPNLPQKNQYPPYRPDDMWLAAPNEVPPGVLVC